MHEHQKGSNLNNNQNLEPALHTLDKITELIESPGSDQEIQSALETSLTLYDQAKEILLAEDQPWLAAWVDLQKATFHCELAQMAKSMGRAIQIHTAMELIGEVLTVLQDLPPSTELAVNLYSAMIIPLYQIRSFFEEPEELEALDNLIRGVGENIGEALALDLSLRAEANDLKYTAENLKALADLEEDPEIKKDMLETSQGLSRQADDNLTVSSPLDLSGYETPREEK